MFQSAANPLGAYATSTTAAFAWQPRRMFPRIWMLFCRWLRQVPFVQKPISPRSHLDPLASKVFSAMRRRPAIAPELREFSTTTPLRQLVFVEEMKLLVMVTFCAAWLEEPSLAFSRIPTCPH